MTTTRTAEGLSDEELDEAVAAAEVTIEDCAQMDQPLAWRVDGDTWMFRARDMAKAVLEVRALRSRVAELERECAGMRTALESLCARMAREDGETLDPKLFESWIGAVKSGVLKFTSQRELMALNEVAEAAERWAAFEGTVAAGSLVNPELTLRQAIDRLTATRGAE